MLTLDHPASLFVDLALTDEIERSFIAHLVGVERRAVAMVTASCAAIRMLPDTAVEEIAVALEMAKKAEKLLRAMLAFRKATSPRLRGQAWKVLLLLEYPDAK